jgi:hypothetical protein
MRSAVEEENRLPKESFLCSSLASRVSRRIVARHMVFFAQRDRSLGGAGMKLNKCDDVARIGQRLTQLNVALHHLTLLNAN